MPTNLKTLLSRSRSRSELKSGRPGEGKDESLKPSCSQCGFPTDPIDPRLERSGSCKSLEGASAEPSAELSFCLCGAAESPESLSMRKSETVVALSSFSGNGVTSSPSLGGAGVGPKDPSPAPPFSSTSTGNPSGKVRGMSMKDKIFSTSSSTLNNLISGRTTSKLFSGWKLPGSGTAGCLPPATSTFVGKKSRSQLSIEGPPLTPTNRLRRKSSLKKDEERPASRSSSIASFVCWRDEDGPKEILCRLCLSTVKEEETMEIEACLCRYCKDCVMAYVNFEIQEGAADIACPDATCDKEGVLSLKEIQNLVAPNLLEKYQKFKLYKEVEKDGHLMWCPSPGCETVCRIVEENRSPSKSNKSGGVGLSPLKTINCTTCGGSYCADCKLSPPHLDISCDSYRRKLLKAGKLSFDEEESLFSNLDSIKKCPFCHVLIEKDSGCAQMMCKRCKHVFCWYCLASLDDDFLLRHYDKGPCKNKLGHSRASVVWHRAQVIGIFAGFGVLVLLASPILILAAPCLLCCRCRYCANKLDPEETPVTV